MVQLDLFIQSAVPLAGCESDYWNWNRSLSLLVVSYLNDNMSAFDILRRAGLEMNLGLLPPRKGSLFSRSEDRYTALSDAIIRGRNQWIKPLIAAGGMIAPNDLIGRLEYEQSPSGAAFEKLFAYTSVFSSNPKVILNTVLRTAVENYYGGNERTIIVGKYGTYDLHLLGYSELGRSKVGSAEIYHIIEILLEQGADPKAVSKDVSFWVTPKLKILLNRY